MTQEVGAPERTVWVDGSLYAESQAPISPFDHGLLTGDGIYETLVARDGVPFAWSRHLRRMHAAAEAVGLTFPPGVDLRAAVEATVAANSFDPARVRLTLTGGPSLRGYARGESSSTLIVAAVAYEPPASTADVMVAPWPRNQRAALAGIKTTSGGEAVQALAWARERGAHEAIFADLDGHLCEGTSSNVFVVSRGQLSTPALSTGCLDGVTRQLVVEVLCPRLEVECRETEMPVGALAGADEAFVTSSTRGIQPVARVDERALPAAPGPLTTTLQQALAALVADDLDP